MGKILKVTIKYEDKIYIAEGKDAESWSEYVGKLSGLAMVHGDVGWYEWNHLEEKKKKCADLDLG